MTEDEPDAGTPDGDVGSVGEEAAKLLGALSDWAQHQDLGGGLSGLSGLAGQAAHAARQVDEHLATGAPECTVCPVCRAVHAVRRTSPEVRVHLATAASSLLQAAAGLMATAVPPEHRDRAERSEQGASDVVERIDLDEPGGTEDDA